MKKATIIVKDEVNIKIEGLELSTRRKLTGKFKYEIPGARYMPAVRLGRWDGKVAFFQLGGSSYVNLLPEIIPVLIEENYEVELDDNIVTRSLNKATEFPYDTMTSLQRDIAKGKEKNELDIFAESIIKAATKYGVSVPNIQRVYKELNKKE